jgi:hypothetical protein
MDRDLTEALVEWLAGKPYGAGMSRAERVGLILSIVGSWTLYLQKRGSAACPPELTEERMLTQWADHWAAVLEGSGAAQSKSRTGAGGKHDRGGRGQE